MPGATAEGRNGVETQTKRLVQAGLDKRRDGAGSVFEVLAPDATLTIVGNSPFWTRVSPGWHKICCDVALTPIVRPGPIDGTFRNQKLADDLLFASFAYALAAWYK